MAEIHDQLEAEGVIKEAKAMMIKGKTSGVNGRLYVTKDRVVFLKSNPLFLSFGLIGGLLGAGMKPKKVALDINRSAISSVQQGKFGRAKHIVEIHHGDCESVRLVAEPWEEWKAAIDTGAASPT